MKTWIGVAAGIVLGLGAVYVSNKLSKKEINIDDFNNEVKDTNSKESINSTEDQSKASVSVHEEIMDTTTHSVSETQDTITGTEIPVEKEAKDLTLTETITKYTQEENPVMVDRVHEIINYLEENDIYIDPTIGEADKPKTVDELCKVVTAINNKIKLRFDEELDHSKSAVLSKSTRKLVKIVPLPVEIQSSTNYSNTAYTRTIRLTHITEARSRINRLTRRFTIETMKVLEKDWFQILYNVVEMHKDLNRLDPIMPRITNTHPSVNVIADTEFVTDNRKAYFRYLENTLNEEEYLYYTKYNKELEFSQWK